MNDDDWNTPTERNPMFSGCVVLVLAWLLATLGVIAAFRSC